MTGMKAAEIYAARAKYYEVLWLHFGDNPPHELLLEIAQKFHLEVVEDALISAGEEGNLLRYHRAGVLLQYIAGIQQNLRRSA